MKSLRKVEFSRVVNSSGHLFVILFLRTSLSHEQRSGNYKGGFLAIEKIGDWKNWRFWYKTIILNIVGERHTASTSQQRER